MFRRKRKSPPAKAKQKDIRALCHAVLHNEYGHALLELMWLDVCLAIATEKDDVELRRKQGKMSLLAGLASYAGFNLHDIKTFTKPSEEKNDGRTDTNSGA